MSEKKKLQEKIDNLLRPYHGARNDEATRAKVKAVIQSFLDELPLKEPVLVVCDEHNNTPETVAKNELCLSFFNRSGEQINILEQGEHDER